MKKTAFILFSNGIGGAERAVEKLMTCSLANDKNTILIVNSEIYDYFSKALGCNSVIDIGKLYLNVSILRKFRRVFDVTKIFIWLKRRKVKKILKDLQVDTVVTHLMYDLYLMFKLKICDLKLISVVHGLIGFDESLPKYIFDPKFSIKMLGYTDEIITVSPTIKKFLIEQKKIPGDKVSVIENGVDVESFSKKNKDKSTPVSFLFCGGVKPIKGGHLLCIVAKEMLNEGFDFTITIAGPENDASFWSELGNIFPGNVNIVGFVSEIKLNQMICEHDCVVMPSISEGAPLVAFDSIKLRTPILASEIPSFKNYIHENYRFKLNKNSLKDMLVKFLNDKDFRENYMYVYEPSSWMDTWACYKKIINND